MKEKKTEQSARQKRKYISIYWKCCHTYSHIYLCRKTHYYVGNCPRCSRSLSIPTASHGTRQRIFIAE